MKVGYHGGYDYHSGKSYKSTAYLDEEVEPDVWVGTDKYTDEPVKLWWNGAEWVPVKSRQKGKTGERV